MKLWSTKDKMSNIGIKSVEKIVIFAIIIFISIGFILNYKLINSVKDDDFKPIVTNEERNAISDVWDSKDIDRKEFEEQYLEIVQGLENSTKLKDKEHIGKVYYLLGINSLSSDNYDNAIVYLNKCIDFYKNTNNYFYLLRANENLMNIYMIKSDQAQALKHGNEMYGIMHREDIYGMSDNELVQLEMRVLSSILTTTSTLEMKDISDKIYAELVQVSEELNNIPDNISIYAKYQYNLNNKNYEEAKKYALEYVDDFKNNTQIEQDCANIYLLEVLIHKGELNNIDEVFKKVERGYNEKNHPLLFATLDKMKGLYHQKLGNYELSVEYLEKAIVQYEELDSIMHANELNDIILSYSDEINIDLKKYLNKRTYYSEIDNYITNLGNLSSSLVEVLYSKSDEESHKIKEEANNTRIIVETTKKINIIYIVIIILLVYMTFTLIKEITMRNEKETELKEIVKTDYLTKAYSKQNTYDLLQKKINNKKDFAVLMFDLDHFKKINDTYGHLVGDKVLISVVKAVKEVLSNNDHIGRFGGEEFIVVINNTKILKQYVEVIRNKIKSIQWDIDELHVTISGGVTTSGDKDIHTIILEADEKLYEAKSSGRDKIIL